mmetsp:Transcript_15606/g.23642  ORF Transcript_15606/g.23642 Transcript_15606/m.23642 type:complete len:153 (-) Transcript_15606:227-685(-)|eukprot:CAMPEP_0178924920 /NCGR_PEP_ID=MMETSP0786-20121207/17600_1 /TAXON_ID=186022 /ORGANISM="Thalassionema frauenfeldii, Strain CCMP 1798" /LENGTH=152 /DNA_ID=CAMNT_0020599695 /DNA_START=75 /DNA_END=533 /DNA_ORIENTATION=+
MAEESDRPDVATFDTKEYDVTCCCDTLFCGSKTLTLGPDEAELVGNCCFKLCTSNKRGPYGELGTVDKSTCACFVGFIATSLTGSEDMICTGCGCDDATVTEIVSDLKERQGMRGDRAKTRMGESTLKSLESLHKKVDMIMANMEIERESEA